MIGAKKRRKEEYIKMKNEKTKKFNQEQKAQIREVNYKFYKPRRRNNKLRDCKI